MPGFTTIFLGLSAAFGGLITIFTWYLFNSLGDIYRTFNLREIRLIFYGFASFLFSSLSLLVINIISLGLDIMMMVEYEILITLNEISYILYNFYLIIGLGLLIISNLRGKSEKIYETHLTQLVPVIITLVIILKMMSLILIIELIIFIFIMMKRQHRLFSSNLWTASLILIMIGRVTNLAFPSEFAYMAVIYFDLFAFTSLVLMILEARERVLRSEV